MEETKNSSVSFIGFEVVAIILHPLFFVTILMLEKRSKLLVGLPTAQKTAAAVQFDDIVLWCSLAVSEAAVKGIQEQTKPFSLVLTLTIP